MSSYVMADLKNAGLKNDTYCSKKKKENVLKTGKCKLIQPNLMSKCNC